MRREDIDWKELRGVITALVICLVVASSMLYASLYFKKQMKQEFARNDARFKSISQRYLAVDEEEKLITEYYPKFIELYNNGVIGKEQRLNWIEVLRRLTSEMKLPRLSYQIESQQPYTPGYSVKMGEFKVYSSKMNLDMALMHEGDLFTVIEELEKKAKGDFAPASCNMQSMSAIVEEPDAANITVSCELRWYTIKLADGSEIKI
jgi:hypothetical protein